ncbi:RNA methyltransferase [Synechocystis sp. LEGE 06083]|uniref:TrmH family RNA methyltransferase n=1 Tax=Synechocystis sp. LEGE 06083 TaxID=915336 RepID=UPI00187DDAB6|nr:RNA methyltransferase [Synechocystis sp. LEGE 06083]
MYPLPSDIASITSTQNPLVKQLRQLHQTKGRKQQGQLLLEGTHLLEVALAEEKQFNHGCFTAVWQSKNPTLADRLVAQSAYSYLVSGEVLAKMASTVNPDGVVATLAMDQFWRSPPIRPQLGLVLERLQDPGNLGTILRTAAATGVEGIWLTDDCVDPTSPKVLRSSAGSSLLLPQQQQESLLPVLEKFQAQGLQLIATVPQGQQTLWEIDFQRPTIVIFGSEGQGLSAPVLELTTQQVAIPQAPAVESLNVAIAVGVMLYEARRQQWSASTPN